MELTLAELAVRVGMTPRNIREWQTIGVLPPPQRRGRTAVYGDAHLARIERVKALRADGFPLDIIRQFLDRSDETAADVLSLSAMVLDPTGQVGTTVTTRADLTERLGPDAEEALLRCGVIAIGDDDRVTVTDTAILDYIEELTGFGMPIAAIGSALDVMLQQQARSIESLVDVYREAVWQPFVDAGLPAAEFHRIAQTAGRMRDVLTGLGAQTLRRAIDVVIAHAAVEQATKLDSGGTTSEGRR